MKKFVYQARDNQGKMISGYLMSENLETANINLKEKNYWILGIKEESSSKFDVLNINLDVYLDKIGFNQVGLKDIVIFCRQFATLINSGISAVKALTILSEQIENKFFADVLKNIKHTIEQGSELSVAFAAYPKIFDPLFVNMVKAGEAGGVLDEVLDRLAKFYEERAKLGQKIKSAMTYPVVVLVFALIIFFVMLTFILPQFSKLFMRLDADLPAYTQFLIDLSHFLTNLAKFPNSILLIIFITCIIVGFKKIYSTETGRYYIDKFFLSLPVFGSLIKKVSLARFTRTFATLLKSGVPIISSLEIVADSISNYVVAKSVKSIIVDIKQGSTIYEPLEKEKVFPPMVISMIAVGEETGELDAMLFKVADFYETEVDNAVESLTSIIEPIMLVLIGGIVGSVIVGMYLPMFKMFDNIH
ncbi:MAG: type II secretion system F family protein [Candidatus Gastranaerophilaceae bacterium]|jgi:type IV pilus assembly protein PilC